MPPVAAAAIRRFAKAALDASNRRPAISLQIWKSPARCVGEHALFDCRQVKCGEEAIFGARSRVQFSGDHSH